MPFFIHTSINYFYYLMKIINPTAFISSVYPIKMLIFISFFTALLGVTTYAGENKTTSKSSQKRLVEDEYSTDKKTITKGQVLFENNCSACHNFLQKGIGPELSTVTTVVPSEWLKKFIQNAPEMISSGDARASMLFDEYKQVMPAFTTLPEADIKAIMSFIHSKRKTETTASVSSHLGTPISNPVPKKIEKSGLHLKLDYLTTAPPTAAKLPLARINKMLKLAGAKDRLFIVDLRGKLYEIIDDQLVEFMDIAKEIPGFIHAPGLATGFGNFAFHPDFYRNGLFTPPIPKKEKLLRPILATPTP